MPRTLVDTRFCTAPGDMATLIVCFCFSRKERTATAQFALMEWLAQYPEDARFTPIAEALHRHMAGA